MELNVCVCIFFLQYFLKVTTCNILRVYKNSNIATMNENTVFCNMAHPTCQRATAVNNK